LGYTARNSRRADRRGERNPVKGRQLGRVAFAAVAAITAVLGTLGGGAAYETAHPAYQRIVWVDRSGGNVAADRVIRRALFSDGRFVSLSAAGYRAGTLAPEATAELFATASGAAPEWKAEYPATTTLGELIDLEFEGTVSRTIRIANPGTNLSLPPALTRILLILGAADRRTQSVPFKATSLHFWAVPAQGSGGEPLDTVPDGFPIEAAASADGVRIGGGELAVLNQFWTDLPTRFAPGLAHRFVQVNGAIWRLSWTIDLDTIAGLAGTRAP